MFRNPEIGVFQLRVCRLVTFKVCYKQFQAAIVTSLCHFERTIQPGKPDYNTLSER
jgi:hypothetical protein